MTGDEVVARLVQNGWTEKSREDMQVKLTKAERVVIVPIRNGTPLNPGLLKAIEKQTGVALT